MTGTNCDLFTHKSSSLYLNHLVIRYPFNGLCYFILSRMFVVSRLENV
jgi:hypothetical protein